MSDIKAGDTVGLIGTASAAQGDGYLMTVGDINGAMATCYYWNYKSEPTGTCLKLTSVIIHVKALRVIKPA